MLYFLGAINGKFDKLIKVLTKANVHHSNIFHLGDLGNDKKDDNLLSNLLELDKFLSVQNNKLYFIRGGKDNISSFVQSRYTNIVFLENHNTKEIKERKIFVMGGGLTVEKEMDKIKRVIKKSDNIKFNFPIIEDLRNVDIVVTYKAPPYIFDIFTDNFYMEWVVGDACLENQLSDERDLMHRMMKTIMKNNDISYWFCSYPARSISVKNDNVNFISLNEFELYNL
jgi:predicted phosphodiesterase